MLVREIQPFSFKEMVGNKSTIETFEAMSMYEPGDEHGFPPLMLFEGKSGTGKCVEGRSLVATPNGLRRIRSLTMGADGFVEKQIDVLTSSGSETTSHVYEEDVDTTVEIRLQLGGGLRGTIDHPVLTFSGGHLCYRKLKNLERGDLVVLRSGVGSFGDGSIDYDDTQSPTIALPSVLTPDWAYILGAIVANGVNSGEYITISTQSASLISDITTIGLRTGLDTHVKEKAHLIRTGTARQNHFLRHLLDGRLTTARYKHVPDVVLRSSKEAQISFLKALFECDAYYDRRSPLLEYTTASKDLRDDVTTMLLNLGVVPTVRLKRVIGYDHSYWVVNIGGESFDKWIELSGSTPKYQYESTRRVKNTNLLVYPGLNDLWRQAKQDCRRRLSVNRGGWYKIDGESHLFPSLLISDRSAPSRSTLIKMRDALHAYLEITESSISQFAVDLINEILHEGLIFSRVAEVIVHEEPIRVYDLTLPKGHQFIANGIVNHNTTCALIIAALLARDNAVIDDSVGPDVDEKGVAIVHHRRSPKVDSPASRDIRQGRFARDVSFHNASKLKKDGIIALEERIMTQPLQDGHRTVIIDEAQELSSGGKGAALAMLEKKSKKTTVILCTMDVSSFDKALTDRAKTYHFEAPKVDEIQVYLEHVIYDSPVDFSHLDIPREFFTKGLNAIAYASFGSVRAAVQLLDRALESRLWTVKQLEAELGAVTREKTKGLIDLLYRREVDEAIAYVEAIDPKAVEGFMRELRQQLFAIRRFQITGSTNDFFSQGLCAEHGKKLAETREIFAMVKRIEDRAYLSVQNIEMEMFEYLAPLFRATIPAPSQPASSPPPAAKRESSAPPTTASRATRV